MKKVNIEKRLEYLDDLTGLYNRRYFRERILEEKRKADQSISRGFALMMIDLDNFKPINDTYGHLTGDQVLNQVGRLLKESIRSADILCRYAGDEFVVILPETNEEEVIGVSERIKENFAKATWHNDKGNPIQTATSSLGYAFYSEKGSDLNQLIGWADQALYVVKRRGGNGYFGGKELPEESTGRPLSTTPHIVGRENEMRQLKSLIQDDQTKEGKFVLIHGEAGVGKTRLIRELQHLIERRGGLTLLGGCHEETRSIPYFPFREAFNRFFEVGGAETSEGRNSLQDLPDYARKELVRILPGLSETTPSELERAPDPFRLFESVRLLLQNLSARFGLFIIEDLHWSDEASLDLIQYLARNLKSPSNSPFNKGGMRGILLCGTYRTEEVEGDTRFVRFSGSLRKEELSLEIPLKSLSADGVSSMLHLLTGGTKVSQDFQDFLYQKTEGNPFFVEQILKFLSEEEISGLRTPPKKLAIPGSIHALLERRIDHLAPEIRKILACAALIGEKFDFEVLMRVLNQPEKEILEAVEEGVTAHIVQESFEGGGDRFRFIHALMADVLYSGVGKTRRRMWHGKVGEVLEDVYSGKLEVLNGQLVYHFEQGEKWEKAIKYTLKWAKKAKEEYANQEAIRLYKKAREVLPRLSVGPESGKREKEIPVAEELGDVYQLTGKWKEALQEYQRMEEISRNLKDEIKEGEANLKLSSVYYLQGNNDEAMNYCEKSYEILRRIGDLKGIANSLFKIGNVHKSRGDFGEALKCFEESLNIGRKISDNRVTANNLTNIGLVHLNRGDHGEALKYFKEDLKIERKINDKRGMAKNLHNTGLVYLNRGDYEEALKCMKESLTISREIGYMNEVAIRLHNIGLVLARRGDSRKALKCLKESLTISREMGDKRGMAYNFLNIGNVHLNRGDYEEALKCMKESLTISREMGDKKGMANNLNNIGNVYTSRGDYEEALKYLKESLTIRREISDKQGLVYSLGEMGTLHQSLNELNKAREYHKEALTLINESEMEVEKVKVLTGIGIDYYLSGDHKNALENLNKALETVEKLGLKDIEMNVLNALSEVWLSKFKEHSTISSHSSTKGKLNSEKFIKTAKEYCERLLKIAEKEELKSFIANGRKIRGEILLAEASSGKRSAVSSKLKAKSQTLTANLIKEAEKELKEALKIATEIGESPLLWQIHASLGKVYQEAGDEKKVKKQFSKAKEIINDIASKIGDENLKDTFLNSEQIRTVLENC